MRPDDPTRLKHMRDAAREALSFALERTREDLACDRQFALSVVKSIEIIGEAASGVTAECRERHLEIPWKEAVGMRHRLVHAYFEIDFDRVWILLQDHLPPLVAALERIIESEEANP